MNMLRAKDALQILLQCSVYPQRTRSGSCFKAVRVCWYTFYRPQIGKDGKLGELMRERRSPKCSTLDQGWNRTGNLGDWEADTNSSAILSCTSCYSLYLHKINFQFFRYFIIIKNQKFFWRSSDLVLVVQPKILLVPIFVVINLCESPFKILVHDHFCFWNSLQC